MKRLKTIAITLAVLIATVGISAFIGIHVHGMQKEILQQKGELIAKESAREYDRYIFTRMSILQRVAYSVEELSLQRNENVLAFLTNETNYILNMLGAETTGLYGWINGEFLDGAGWVPDEGFVATERPWYKQAMTSGRKITFVDPYLDAQTHTMMITIAELLKDGESVVALDVSLDHIQRIVMDVASRVEGSQALVLNSDGVVIAHSDENQLGQNYSISSEENPLGHMIAQRILEEGHSVFEVSTKEANYAVYAEALESGWYSVSVINTDAWHQPLHRLMAVFFSILGVVVLSIVIVFLRMSAKNIALEKLHTRIDEEEKRGEQLQVLSETDRMTGLNDRVSGARKVNESDVGGLFIELDIDHFKSINDRFGHQTGDAVILAVADAMRKTFRANDVTMRLGGDEFGAFAGGIMDRETAEVLIGRLFNRIVQIDVLGEEKVCISVGAALCSEPERFENLYQRADDALYASKKEAGNYMTFG